MDRRRLLLVPGEASTLGVFALGGLVTLVAGGEPPAASPRLWWCLVVACLVVLVWTVASSCLHAWPKRRARSSSEGLEARRRTLALLLENLAAAALRKAGGAADPDEPALRAWEELVRDVLCRWMDDHRVEAKLREWGLMAIREGKTPNTPSAVRDVFRLAGQNLLKLVKDLGDGSIARRVS